MALRIYIRQHSPKCMRRLSERMNAGEIEILSKEDLMDYRHCKCGWWMYGTTDNGTKIAPKALKVYSYGEACQEVKKANRSQGAEGDITLADLLEKFLEERRDKNRTHETESIYQRIGQRLVDFAGTLNPPVTLAAKFTRDHVVKMRSLYQATYPEVTKLSTVNYHMGIMGMIFRYGVNNGKLTTNPLQGLKSIGRSRERGADADEEEDQEGQTMPLDPEGGDANYRKLLDNVDAFLSGKLVVVGRKFSRAKVIPVFTTVRLTLIMELMYETGLRVSDATHFRPCKMIQEDDECVSYTTKQIKTGDDVTVFIPLALAQRLAALAPAYRDYVFYDNSMPWRQFISGVVYRLISDLGNAVGVSGARPHRFRDSFAVNRLNELIGIEYVSAMLGHRKLETTKKYYSPWVKSRHEVFKTVWKTGREVARQQALAPAAAKPTGLTLIRARERA